MQECRHMRDSLLDRVLTAAASLTSHVAPFAAAPLTGDEVTIFIPGYKGSFLLTPAGENGWVAPHQVVSRGWKTLALPFEGQQATPLYDVLLPGSPITALSLVPRVVAVEVYLRWMTAAARELPGFIAFGYDWRHDIRANAQQLSRFIENLAMERGGQLRVNLVGHSMGGLLALTLLRFGHTGERWSGAKYVRRIVFAGVPFRGAPAIFDDILVGTATGRNTALLSNRALFSFPSSFQLLPDDDDFFASESGHQVRMDLGLVETWREHGWSVLADPKLRDDARYRVHLGRMLSARRTFHDELQHDLADWPESVEALTIVGRGRPTDAKWRWEKDLVALRNPLREDGDGDVLTTRAQPLPGMQTAVVETKAAHAFILSDRDVQRRVFEFLKARR
jgi:pimeloyl-ACP methyl ester carboxylesterase